MENVNGFIMTSTCYKTDKGVLIEITLNPHTWIKGNKNNSRTDLAKYKLFSHEVPLVGLFDKSLNNLVASFKRELRYHVLKDLKQHYYPEIEENLKLHSTDDYFYIIEA